jgi:Flp pilus assembly protein TadG
MIRRSLKRLAHDCGGSMAIETAAVAPILILLSIGTFEVARMVSRQQELQSAASEGETIALAASQAGQATGITTVRDIIAQSVSLNSDQVHVARYYRCDANATIFSAADDASARATCGTDSVITSYLKLELTDRYSPIWTRLGIGSAFDYDVQRMVQL